MLDLTKERDAHIDERLRGTDDVAEYGTARWTPTPRKAELLDDPAVSTALPAYAEKYKQRLTLYGWTGEAMAQDYSQAIRVTPTKFLR